MRAEQGIDRITVWQGDITKLDVDAVVNAANDEAAFTGQRQRERDGRPSAIVKCNVTDQRHRDALNGDLCGRSFSA
jgi:hypothetical protein